MKKTETLFLKMMTRREFLLNVGILLITLTGIPGFLNTIEKIIIGNQAGLKSNSSFGLGPYGGTKKGGK